MKLEYSAGEGLGPDEGELLGWLDKVGLEEGTEFGWLDKVGTEEGTELGISDGDCEMDGLIVDSNPSIWKTTALFDSKCEKK